MAVWESSKNHSQGKSGQIAWRPLLWLNLVCLDAPLIAVGWKWLFARQFGVTMSASATYVLFLTAWLIYAADRLADAICLRPLDPKSLRHEFCLRHRRLWLVAIVLIALADAGIALALLEPALFRPGLVLGVVATLYLVINYWFNQVWQTVPIKECLVGSLFAAGTLFAPAVRISSITSTFLMAGFLFAILCSLNCVSIAVWERDLDDQQGKRSIATRWAGAAGLAQWTPLILAAMGVVMAFLHPARRALFVSLAASAVFLSCLHFASIRRDERTALADLVLLTPYLLLLMNVS